MAAILTDREVREIKKRLDNLRRSEASVRTREQVRLIGCVIRTAEKRNEREQVKGRGGKAPAPAEFDPGLFD